MVKQLPGDIVRIKFLKEDFNYKAGQYAFICIPKISVFEWHPFSFSSSPHDKFVTLHVRALGNWTKQLYKKVGSTKDQHWSIMLHGPYGLTEIDVDGPRYKIFLLFTGGIGITPMQSIANELFYQSTHGRDIIKIIFVWSVREIEMVNDVLKFDEEFLQKAAKKRLPIAFQPDTLVKDDLNTGVLETYCHLTKMKAENSMVFRTVDESKHRYLKYERPNIKEYFEMAKDLAAKHKQSEVAVLVCGPGPLSTECRDMAYKCSGNGIKFDYHSEVFEF